MKVFVTGATGFVGTAVVKRLIAEGHDPVCLVRPESHSSKNRSTDQYQRVDAQIVSGDLLKTETYSEALMQCDAVIHLVGIIRENKRQGATFDRIHIEGTKKLVEASARNGIRRFVHMSALGAREQAVSDYHRSKYEAEQIVQNSRIPHVIFRPSVIFGPNDEFVNMLSRLVKLPVTPVIGDGRYRLQPVSLHTISEILEKALTIEAENEIFEVGGPERISYNEMLMEIGRALHKKVRLMHQPLWLMKPLIQVMQRFSFFPITENQLTMLLEENICRDGNRFAERFAVREIPFSSGIREYL